MKIKDGYKKYTIKSISLEIKTGKTPPSNEEVYYNKGNINWFTPSDIGSSSILNNSSRKITQASIDKKVAVTFKPNTVLITCIGEIGRVGIVENFSSSNQQITGISVNEKIVSYKFFYYWLIRNRNLLKHYSNYSVIPILNNSILEKIPIYLPDIDIQNKVIAQLDLIQSLIDKRRKTIDLLEEMIKSTFLKMFGDPINNPMDWKVESLEDLVDEECSLSYGIIKADEKENGVPIVRPVDLNSIEELNPIKLKKVDIKISNRYKTTILQGNEILLCVRGNVGLTKQSNISIKNGNVSRGIVPIRLNYKINNAFFLTLLKTNSMQNKLKSLSRGIALKQLNIGDLRKLKIIVPNKNLNEFEKFYNTAFLQKSKLADSLEVLEVLFKSLIQDVFNEKELINESYLFDDLVKTFTKEDYINDRKRISYLINALNDNKFKDFTTYEEAKNIAFELLNENIISQTFDEVKQKIELQIS